MSRYNRHQSVISRQSDSIEDENNWLSRIQKSLQKDAVQPRSVDQSIFEQINNIVGNKKPKYPSVQAAVDDMKQRSGLTAYLENVKTSKNDENTELVQKTASDNNAVIDKKVHMIPIVIKKCPNVDKTLRNYVTSSGGNLPIPAIIDKIKSIHRNDVSDADDWEGDDLIRYVSRLNLEEKSKKSSGDENHHNLGKQEFFSQDDIDPSNTDAFNILNPVKM